MAPGALFGQPARAFMITFVCFLIIFSLAFVYFLIIFSVDIVYFLIIFSLALFLIVLILIALGLVRTVWTSCRGRR